MRVEGQPTGSLVWLHASPSAASIPTPYGTVGIEPATAVPIAKHQAARPGSLATIPFLHPPEPAWAEAELPLQAFAIDFAQPPNVTLSEAASPRLLGSRVVAEQERVLEFGGPSARATSSSHRMRASPRTATARPSASPFTGAQTIVSTDLWSNRWLEGVSAP